MSPINIMWPFCSKSNAKPDVVAAPVELRISADDDLLTRAENIVWFLGYRGATGDFVLQVHRLLREYEKADKLARKNSSP